MTRHDLPRAQISKTDALANIASILEELGGMAAEIDDAIGACSGIASRGNAVDTETLQKVDLLRQSIFATATLVSNVTKVPGHSAFIPVEVLTHDVVLGAIRAAGTARRKGSTGWRPGRETGSEIIGEGAAQVVDTVFFGQEGER